ncbi:MAG: DUF3368 domain-containing protein [Pyrinomonadaceae bacterium]
MNKRIVVNTGPIIAFGKIGVFDLIRQLPFDFITPIQVQTEITIGSGLGYSVEVPSWIEIVTLAEPTSRLVLANLDAGEAAVIEVALQLDISVVCIDELKGRRAAIALGLNVVGSLGVLGKAKKLGLINSVRPLVEKAQESGVYYDEALVERFFREIDE